MPFKQFNDDEVLYSDIANRYFIQQHSVIKSADESVTNSIVPQNDDHLFVPLLANTMYFVEFFLIYDAPSASDIQIQWTAPSGTVWHWTHGGLGTSAASTVGPVSRNFRTLPDTGTIGGPSASSGTECIIPGQGRVTCGATPGNLQLQWCQVTAGATATVVKANSVIIAQRLTT